MVFCPDVYDPFDSRIFGENNVDIYNTLSAGLVMGIMILPLVSSMSEDALSSQSALAARSCVRPGRDPAGNSGADRRARCPFWHNRRLHYRHIQRSRRNHDRSNCCWLRAQLHL
jgi:hypothetical protein